MRQQLGNNPLLRHWVAPLFQVQSKSQQSMLLCAASVLLLRLLQVDEMPADLANVRVSFKDFSTMAYLRQHLYMLSFALDFCYQVQALGGCPAWR